MLRSKKVSVITTIFTVVFLGIQTASAELKVDFNSLTQGGGPNQQDGLEGYDAGHERAADFIAKDYEVSFPSGDATVTMTPAWPNTTDNRVQQMIDRGAGNDANWVGNDIDLLTDWIGSDSRTGNGGNGDWDRTDATDPTYMTLSLGGLPAGDYFWTSYHHDTENMWSDFQVEVSTDGGTTYGPAVDREMTSSSPGGNPAAPIKYLGDVNPDPKKLPSTFTTRFTADGDKDVVLRFAPFADGVDAVQVHKRFFGMNGFELIEFPMLEVPALSTWGLLSLALLALVGGSVLIRRRRACVVR